MLALFVPFLIFGLIFGFVIASLRRRPVPRHEFIFSLVRTISVQERTDPLPETRWLGPKAA
ncbi:MAG TPA: hypothetical protein VD837_17210 [Terriglobales bacterium]|nr:hypothetical protein [Terriglobales bacterium]